MSLGNNFIPDHIPLEDKNISLSYLQLRSQKDRVYEKDQLEFIKEFKTPTKSTSHQNF